MINWSNHKVWSAEQIHAEAHAGASWGAPIEVEVRNRIQLSVATYAYELRDSPIMVDLDWDRLAQGINPRLGTCHPLVDEFFAGQFSPMTGVWIHEHPELDKIKRLFDRYYVGQIREYCERMQRTVRRRSAAA